MYNIIIDYKLFKNEINDILDKIKINGSRIGRFNIIFKNMNNDDYHEMMDNNEFINKSIFNIYNKVIDYVTEDNIEEALDTRSYIKDVSCDVVNPLVLAKWYLQQIHTFSGLRPLSSSLVELKEDKKFYLVINNEIVGDLDEGEYITEYHIQNKFFSKKGFCNKCLNPFCNMYKRGCIKYMIDPKECEVKTKLLEYVPEEVKEVSQEQYIYLLEVLSEVMNNSNTVAGLVLKDAMSLLNK